MTQAIHYYNHVTALGNITLQGRVLGGVTVNTKGSGGNILTVYDGTDATGVVIAIIDCTAAVGTFLYDSLALSGALFAVLANGGAADLTIATY